jgi:hypothetical protein
VAKILSFLSFELVAGFNCRLYSYKRNIVFVSLMALVVAVASDYYELAV